MRSHCLRRVRVPYYTRWSRGHEEGDPVDSRDNAGKLDALVGPDLLANIAGFTPTTRAGRMAPLLAKIQQAPVREPHRHRHRAGQPGAR